MYAIWNMRTLIWIRLNALSERCIFDIYICVWLETKQQQQKKWIPKTFWIVYLCICTCVMLHFIFGEYYTLRWETVNKYLQPKSRRRTGFYAYSQATHAYTAAHTHQIVSNFVHNFECDEECARKKMVDNIS